MGVWYCAMHRMYYFCPAKMEQKTVSGRKMSGIRLVEHWLNGRKWPLLTLPVVAFMVVEHPVDFKKHDDFRTLPEMFRWMDQRALRGEGGGL